MDAHRLRSRLPTINATVVETHAEDAAMLAANRTSMVNDPHRRLESLVAADERLSAHLDGLRLAGPRAAAIAAAAFAKAHEPGEVFVFTWIHADAPAIDPAMAELLAQRIADPMEGEALFQALIAALDWRQGEVPAWLGSLLPAEQVRRLNLALASRWGQPGTLLITDLSAGQSPVIISSACRAAACLGRTDLSDAMRPHLHSDDIDVRFHAAWSLALLARDADALAILRWFATSKHSQHERAAIMAARCSSAGDAWSWIAELMTQPTHLRTALIAAGAQGDPGNLPWIIAQMCTPVVARGAGEAFSMITGADLTYLDLDGDQPEGFAPPGFSDDPADPYVDLDADEYLPWPNADLIEAWLSRHRTEFNDGQRHLSGKPITYAQCQDVLRHGYQRQRAAAALELAFLRPDQSLFDVTAPACRQYVRLA